MTGLLVAGYIFSCLLLIAFIVLLIGAIVNSDDFGWGACVCFVFGCVSLTLSIIGTVVSNKHYEEFMYEIVSIKRSNDAEGIFFLGTGNESSHSYYYYYYKDDRGYKLGKQEADDSYIIETDEITPCIYKIKERDKLNAYYKIYVPYNTIITTYILD